MICLFIILLLLFFEICDIFMFKFFFGVYSFISSSVFIKDKMVKINVLDMFKIMLEFKYMEMINYKIICNCIVDFFVYLKMNKKFILKCEKLFCKIFKFFVLVLIF